jgi:hypothetical protein
LGVLWVHAYRDKVVGVFVRFRAPLHTEYPLSSLEMLRKQQPAKKLLLPFQFYPTIL